MVSTASRGAQVEGRNGEQKKGFDMMHFDVEMVSSKWQIARGGQIERQATRTYQMAR